MRFNGVVLLAALARIKIDQRGHIQPRELAVLSGLSARRARQLVESGEIRSRSEGVPAKEAARWLGARGVPGVEIAVPARR